MLTISKMIFFAQFPVECRKCIIEVYEKKIEARKLKTSSSEAVKELHEGKNSRKESKKLNRLEDWEMQRTMEQKRM